MENTIPNNKVTKSNFEVTGGKYSVRLAKDRAEIESALRLRYNVFNVELEEGLEDSHKNKLDEDEYDQHCDHLIVIENSKSKVIGTYRLQDIETATDGIGFYTSAEFNISEFPKSILNNAVELGRACIHREYRNGRVLFLLWRGLAKFMMLTNKRYLFGCCSVTSQDPAVGFNYYNYLKEQKYMHPEYLITVNSEYSCKPDTVVKDIDKIKLPQLFQLYIDVGCKVCSPPALDRQFKTIDFLILLDLETISEQTKTLFFK